MKTKTIFYCIECGNETPKWAGRCPAFFRSVFVLFAGLRRMEQHRGAGG